MGPLARFHPVYSRGGIAAAIETPVVGVPDQRLAWARMSHVPPKKKTAKTETLEATLWAAADKLRGKMDSAVYKHVVLGLIFLKYVSDTFAVRNRELTKLVDDPASDYFMSNPEAKRSVLEDRDEYTAEGVFWVPEGHRWDDLRKAAKQPDIGKRVNAAMDAIERDNPTLKGVLPKEYARQELTAETVGGVIDIFSRQDLAAKEYQGLDVLGRVYEYFLGQFASKEGKKAGEYYTPRSVVQVLVEMLQPYHGRVFDPACGSGGMFVQADKFVAAHGGSRNDISVFGQESNATTWRLAKMNLAVRGIEANLGPQWGDSFTADSHPDLKADYVLANPPFNDSDWGGEKLRGDVRWKFGDPPAQNANYAWLQHFLHHTSPTGTVGTVLANGSLSSQQNGEGEIRKKMVDVGVVECIVALPPQLFYGTPIPVCLWFLTRSKAGGGSRKTRPRTGETLFIDARGLGHMETRTLRLFGEDDIAKIADAYHAWRGTETSSGQPYENVPGFCRVATTAEIADHGYVLTPGRYVGSGDVEGDGEPMGEKIARLAAEIKDGFAERAELQGAVVAALKSLVVEDE
jgi:type I restriction enzyme M protein